MANKKRVKIGKASRIAREIEAIFITFVKKTIDQNKCLNASYETKPKTGPNQNVGVE